MKRLLIAIFSPLLMVAASTAANRVFDVGETAEYTALYPALDAGKLYAGRESHVAENQIVLDVYDLDAAGKPGGMPKSYEVTVPPPVDATLATQARSIVAIGRHPNKKKLYLGYTEGSPNKEHECLVVFNLGAKGEPVGKPRILYPGSDFNSVSAFFVDEKDKILYMTGYCPGLQGTPLDDDGEPKGNAFLKGDFGIGSYSSVMSPDFSYMIYGAHASFFHAKLDHKATNDPLDPVPENFPITGASSFTGVACAGETLFVADLTGVPTTSTLHTWQVDKDTLKPKGLGAHIPKIHPIAVAHHTRQAAYIVNQLLAEDGTPTGFQLLKFEPVATDQTAVPIKIGGDYDSLILKSIAVDEGTGNIYISTQNQ